jgi:hypothetical protein
VGAVAVQLTGFDAGDIGMPYVVRNFVDTDPVGFFGVGDVVEEAEVDAVGVFGENGKINA